MNRTITPRFDSVRVSEHEVGLWFRHGNFRALLMPGDYRVPGPFFGTDRVEVVDTRDVKFEHPLLGAIVASGLVVDALEVVDVADDEQALVWCDGQLGWSLDSGRHAFWKHACELRVEVFKLVDPKLGRPRANLNRQNVMPCGCN